ncbi:TIGR04255 family protein [Zhongshania aliphaticivorans]|jgi:uncharacterized protein (TIGR04255 family)|uniref:TIGR04255 family protein n=1 Tax=Zhongshania aliphaticivorans TaxID=1470434 RepID=UPI0039C90F1A
MDGAGKTMPVFDASELPNKLKKDAIAEALLEIRFESSDIEELVVGRLGDIPNLKGFIASRLPTSDIPEVIRKGDPTLRYQPTIEKRSVNNDRAARIGARVFSYHAYPPYPGWERYQGEINALIAAVFDKLSDLKVTRIGFRYINLLTKSDHLLNKLTDLEFSVAISNRPIVDDLSLSFTSDHSNSTVLTKIVSPNFVNLPPNQKTGLAGVVDIDVFTPQEYTAATAQEVINWVDQAHTLEKKAFFSLIPVQVLEALKEE